MTGPVLAGEDDEARTRAISAVFGDRVDAASAYAAKLCGDGVTRGLIGPHEGDRIWERHLLNSAALAGEIAADLRVLDLGSGAGLPGIPLAIARPDLQLVLLEPMQRRVEFLGECITELDLANVRVQHGRAQAGIDVAVDVVVVRAVAALSALVPMGFPLLRDGGLLLALKGAAAETEMAQLQHSLGITATLVAVPAYGGPATVVRVERPAQWGRESTGRRPAARRRKATR